MNLFTCISASRLSSRSRVPNLFWVSFQARTRAFERDTRELVDAARSVLWKVNRAIDPLIGGRPLLEDLLRVSTHRKAFAQQNHTRRMSLCGEVRRQVAQAWCCGP